MNASRLLTVDAAVALVLDRARPLAPCRVPLPLALGLVLAEPIIADIDLPPFAKATMDGYAVRASDLPTAGTFRLRVVATILAGQVSDQPVGPGEAAAIMTGAPLPPGADAVVNVERTRIDPDQSNLVDVAVAAGVSPGQFVLPRGRELRQGDRLLEPGATISATRVGLIGSVGRGEIAIVPRPSVAIVATGDELVPVGAVPGPGQIRNTNGPMLAALVRTVLPESGPPGTASTEFWFPDQLDFLIAGLGPVLDQHDVLILSGGVSAGVKDLVPAALQALDVEPVFHKVAVKPGKPIWFGLGPERTGGRPRALVFGLPGNPASSVVGFHLFVRPALATLAGRGAHPARIESRPLGQPFAHRGDRPTYHPTRVEEGRLFPLPWAGSADLRTVALADGCAVFAAGDRDYAVGDAVGFLPF